VVLHRRTGGTRYHNWRPKQRPTGFPHPAPPDDEQRDNRDLSPARRPGGQGGQPNLTVSGKSRRLAHLQYAIGEGTVKRPNRGTVADDSATTNIIGRRLQPAQSLTFNGKFSWMRRRMKKLGVR